MVIMHLGILVLIDFADLTCGMLMVHAFTFDPAWLRTRRGFSRTKQHFPLTGPNYNQAAARIESLTSGDSKVRLDSIADAAISRSKGSLCIGGKLPLR